MNENKEIEEMANILCESKNHDCNGEDCKCLKQATDIYNAGYRKIPEDNVVLTEEKLKKIVMEEYEKALKDKVVLDKEEYYELKQAKTLLEFREETIKYLEDANIRYAEELEKARKETAREFYDKIIWFGVKRIGQTTSDSYIQISLERLAEIAKQYGVEVE